VVCSECGSAFTPDQVIRLDNRYVCPSCKPIVVQKLREGVTKGGAEQIRKDYIQHEASVKSVGFLYLLGAAVVLLAAVGMLLSSRSVGSNALVAILLLGLAAVQIWTGLGLRRLQRWARIPSGILSGLGLLGFPFGTLINGYILYLLFSKKGTMVFSEDYQRVIEETPQVKYRTSILVWIFLGLLLLALIGVFVAAFFAKHR
jgi:DNA-directed RNA polymerase subunit RPC12/RpoP/disulfide bond formation protein DsbB